MAISPVSNVVTKNNYNVEFGSKKNKSPQNEAHRSSSGMKAVPVIVLMAMSPLMANNIKAADRLGNENNIELVSGINEKAQVPKKVLREKNIKIGNEDFKIKFMSMNDDNRVSHINVSGTDSQGLLFNHYYDELDNVRFDIVGDDGKTGKTIQCKRILGSVVPGKIRRNYNQELCKYVQDFIDGKVEPDLKSAIKVKDFQRKIRPGSEGDLQNVPTKTDWIQEGIEAEENFGKTPTNMRKGAYNSEMTYLVSPYTNDSNDEDIDAVTIKKVVPPPGKSAEFKVAGLRSSKIKLASGGNDIETFTLNTIELYKRNSKEKVRIIDDNLFDFLLTIANAGAFNNAYECHPITTSVVEVFGEGVVSPVN